MKVVSGNYETQSIVELKIYSMSNIRIIPRLDIKGSNLIKGVHLEGLRVIGDPQEFAVKYYRAGADELIFMDVVASLYGRNNLSGIVQSAAENVFIPITVGGGIRSIEDVLNLLRSGADKVAINTAAVQRPELISEISKKFGSQCLVVSIEAIQTGSGVWEAYTDNGRVKTNLDVVLWAKKVEKLGAGEILLTSINKEGTKKGFDLDLIEQVATSVSIPVIASGGMGSIGDFITAVREGKADAVAVANVLHYGLVEISDIREAASVAGLHVRSV